MSTKTNSFTDEKTFNEYLSVEHFPTFGFVFNKKKNSKFKKCVFLFFFGERASFLFLDPLNVKRDVVDVKHII
ncbi:Uncharacterized protein APZ42_029709 [Daphnia magna]|uniref:Uncharacterized protein n=1 Tax=Daphnia magna TaxID=35525 RepID=A0A164PE40_9CRUS|nr:Uncharacterized protein APZ42_029709 [Daphnia magna]